MITLERDYANIISANICMLKFYFPKDLFIRSKNISKTQKVGVIFGDLSQNGPW